MTYIVNKPADNQTIAQGPADIRAEIAKVANDQVTDAGTLKGLTPGNSAGQIPVSNGIINTGLNAEKLGGNLPSAFAPASHEHGVATGLSHGFIDNASWNKLQGVADGAEVNQNAFSNVLVNGTTIQADAKTDTLELAAGANITLTPDATNDRVTISVSGKTANAAYADSAGSAPANGGNANTVGGYGVGGAGAGNSVVVRDANGYIQNTWYNSTRASENSAAAQYLYDTGDGYMRKKDLANVRKEILAGQSMPASGGTADYAARLLPISGPGSYKLAYAADGARTNPGEWGRVVMRYDGDGQTYGIRCDRADYADGAGNASNANTVGGYTAAQLIANAGGIVAASLGANGYAKFSNGLILQWGSTDQTINSIPPVKFPIAFTNSCFTVALAVGRLVGMTTTEFTRTYPNDIPAGGYPGPVVIPPDWYIAVGK